MSGRRESEADVARVVVVSGPPGFDPASVLFAEGVEVDENDTLVAIERPGNVSVEVLEED